METGNGKNVANFGKIKTAITGYGAGYNPSNVNLKPPAVAAKLTACEAALQAVEPFKVPWRKAIADRIVAYSPVDETVTNALDILIASDGVASTVITDAKQFVRKIK